MSILILVFTQISFAETDTLIASNGDVLVGEIKSMQQGVLFMKTDYSDSDFEIEWEEVKELYTNRNFVVFLSTDKKYFGKIRSVRSDTTEVIIIENDNENEIITQIGDIVYMEAVENDFISQLSIELDLGFTLTKANNLRQLSTRTNLGYLTTAWKADASLDVIWSAQDNAEQTKRTDAIIGFQYFILPAWYLFASGNFLQNDEQKLKLRSTTSAGIGKYFIHTNHLYFGGKLGAARTNESFTDSAETNENSFEGVAGLELNLFNVEDVSLLSTLTVYPSFTQSGRVRTDFRIDLKYDLPLDFYIRLGYTQNYDSKPVEGASKNDYVFQTTVGWEL